MNAWPPAVLLTMGQDVMRQIFRGMLRGCGVRSVEIRPSCEDALALLQDPSRRWDVLVLDGGLPGALETLRAAKEKTGPHLKVILVFSSPTRKEIVEAKAAGVDDLMIYPVSEAVLEGRLRKLMDMEIVRR